MNLKVGFLTQVNLKIETKNLLECIYCESKNWQIYNGTNDIGGKVSSKSDIKFEEIALREEKKKLIKIRKYIENNFEYVGKNFSKRVRDIYYDKKSKKTIYGKATPEEREELADEGINLLSIPWVDKEN